MRSFVVALAAFAAVLAISPDHSTKNAVLSNDKAASGAAVLDGQLSGELHITLGRDAAGVLASGSVASLTEPSSSTSSTAKSSKSTKTAKNKELGAVSTRVPGAKQTSTHQRRKATIGDYLPGLSIICRFLLVCIVSGIAAMGFPYVGMPLITGYLFVGMLAGPEILNVIGHEAIRSLRMVDEIALAFIALAAGAQLQARAMAGRSKSIIYTTIALVVSTFAIGSVAIYSLRHSISFMSPLSDQQAWGVALLGGALLVARSPASAIAIKKELRAEGPFTATIMGTTIISDVIVIVLFSITNLLSNALLADRAPDPMYLWIFLAMMGISVTAGVLVGKYLVPALLVRSKPAGHTDNLPDEAFRGASYAVLLVAGLAIFFVSHVLEPFVEPLIVCMTAGFALANATESIDDFFAFENATARVVNIMFFTLTGSALALSTMFGTLFVIILILFILRVVSIFAGAYLGGFAAGEPKNYNLAAWMAYITQAGVALGLAKKVHVEYDTWGAGFATMMVAIVVMNQLVGPPLFRVVVKLVGEAGYKELSDEEPIYAEPVDDELVGSSSTIAAEVVLIKEQ